MAALCALASAAHAQSRQTAPDDTQSEGPLQEVVVSAQFRQESLQSTPLAISAFTAENLESRGVQSVTNLGAFVPNAVIQPLGAGWGSTVSAYIRGVGLGDNILSFEPGVPIYIDDVYFGRPQGAILDLLDLERVEVLRGPQGTLFGKNAIGGTVRLISRKPAGDGSGYLSVTAGSRDRLNFRGTADVGLIPDRLFARLSFSSKKQDGYFKVLDYECVNGPGSLGAGGPGIPGRPGVRLGSSVPPGGNCVVDTLGDENVQSARAALRLLASDRLELNFIADATRQRQKGPADKYTIIDATQFLNPAWNGAVADPVFGIPWDSRFVTDSPYTNYSRYGTDPMNGRTVPNINDLDHWGAAAVVEWDLTDRVRVKSITGYRRFWNKFGRDSDGSPLPINHTYDDNRHRQFTQEVRLTGTVSKLDWATGAFYYDAFDENRGWDSLLPTVFYELDTHDRQETRNWAVFAHGTYRITEPLSITAGLRYTDDKKDTTILRRTFDGDVTVPNAPVKPEASRMDESLSLQYQWTPDLMTYAKFSTGFRGGGFGPRPQNVCQVNAFEPETLRNYELGGKSELFGRRVRLNGAVFYAKYASQQNFEVIPDDCGGTWFHTTNTGKARIWGTELELMAEPVAGLRVEGSLGYINYFLEDRGRSELCQRDADGDPCYPPRTPEWSAALGLQYAIGLPEYGTLTPRLDAQYQSRISFLSLVDGGPFADTVNGFQGGYTLLNGRIAWQSPDNVWDVTLYGANLTDKAYFLGKLSLYPLLGREQGNVAQPREIGVTIKRSF